MTAPESIDIDMTDTPHNAEADSSLEEAWRYDHEEKRMMRDARERLSVVFPCRHETE